MERLDPRLGGCAGNYQWVPHQLRRGSRVLRYGNYNGANGPTGEVDTCFPNRTVAGFTDNVTLPLNVLVQIGVSATAATAP